MDLTSIDIMTILGMIGGPTGAVWVTLKVGLNGARGDIKEIKKDVKEIGKTLHEEQICRVELEGRVEHLESWRMKKEE